MVVIAVGVVVAAGHRSRAGHAAGCAGCDGAAAAGIDGSGAGPGVTGRRCRGVVGLGRVIKV